MTSGICGATSARGELSTVSSGRFACSSRSGARDRDPAVTPDSSTGQGLHVDRPTRGSLANRADGAVTFLRFATRAARLLRPPGVAAKRDRGARGRTQRTGRNPALRPVLACDVGHGARAAVTNLPPGTF